jgi:hypothetical protein
VADGSRRGSGFTTSTFHIVTGLLPIWRRLPDHDCQVYRIQTDAGERIIGRHIAPTLVATMLRNLGIDHVPTLAPDEAWTGLVEGGSGCSSEGLVLRRSRVMNDYRVELIGFTDAMVPRLKALGLISEIISWKLRLFIPTGGGAAPCSPRFSIAIRWSGSPTAGSVSGGDHDRLGLRAGAPSRRTCRGGVPRISLQRPSLRQPLDRR